MVLWLFLGVLMDIDYINQYRSYIVKMNVLYIWLQIFNLCMWKLYYNWNSIGKGLQRIHSTYNILVIMGPCNKYINENKQLRRRRIALISCPKQAYITYQESVSNINLLLPKFDTLGPTSLTRWHPCQNLLRICSTIFQIVYTILAWNWGKGIVQWRRIEPIRTLILYVGNLYK